MGETKIVDGDIDPVGHITTIALGPLSCGQPPPPWPPSPDSCDADERAAASTVHLGNVTRAQYTAGIALAAHYLDDPDVKSAIASVAHELGVRGTLSHREVKEDVGPLFMRFVDAGLAGL